MPCIGLVAQTKTSSSTNSAEGQQEQVVRRHRVRLLVDHAVDRRQRLRRVVAARAELAERERGALLPWLSDSAISAWCRIAGSPTRW
jgi:hypothetical protein